MAGQPPQAVVEQGVQSRVRSFRMADSILGIAVLSLVLARYIDIRFCGGQTATGVPASMKTWGRCAISLIVGSAVAWATAHGANHLLSRMAQYVCRSICSAGTWGGTV